MSRYRWQADCDALFSSLLQVEEQRRIDIRDTWIEDRGISKLAGITNPEAGCVRPYIIASRSESKDPELTCPIGLCAIYRLDLTRAIHRHGSKHLNGRNWHAHAVLIDH